jgi:hypothetical protein
MPATYKRTYVRQGPTARAYRTPAAKHYMIERLVAGVWRLYMVVPVLALDIDARFAWHYAGKGI